MNNLINLNWNLWAYKVPFSSQTQGTSLFTSIALSQRVQRVVRRKSRLNAKKLFPLLYYTVT